MSVRLEPGSSLLRLTCMTPANFGDTGGDATVDRPAAVDAWDALPYLPASSLKGVLAGQLGNLERPGTSLDPRRRRLFGAPGNAERSARPGQLTLGDGEPLAFPLPLRSGRRATVVVARTVYRLARLGLLALPGLRAVEQGDAYLGPMPASELPAPAVWADFGIGYPALERLAGDTCALLAAPDLAAALWRAAVETRVQTALGDHRRVRAGSLRTVELIPPGTVFVSSVANEAPEAIRLDDVAPLQVGAWEGGGCGYLAIETWRPPAAARDDAVPAKPAAGAEMAADQRLMRRAHRAVLALPRDQAAIARAAVFDFGPRWRTQSLPRALAFCLAKAGGESAPGERGRRAKERAAYRWLLRALLALPADTGTGPLHRRTAETIAGTAAPPATLERTWLWLRRFAENELRAGEAR